MVDRVKLKNGHGGERAGSGRPLGSTNKMPQGLRGKAAEAHMEAGGLMPLDFMLTCLRDNKVSGGEGKNKWEYGVSWEDKKWAADKLLHCFTPRLTNSTVQGTVRVLSLPPEALQGMTDEELDVMERALGKIANPHATNGHATNGHAAVSATAYAQELGEE